MTPVFGVIVAVHTSGFVVAAYSVAEPFVTSEVSRREGAFATGLKPVRPR